jgi:hypothetical protein
MNELLEYEREHDWGVLYHIQTGRYQVLFCFGNFSFVFWEREGSVHEWIDNERTRDGEDGEEGNCI